MSSEDTQRCNILLPPEHVDQCPNPRGHGPEGKQCAEHAARLPSIAQIRAAEAGFQAGKRGQNTGDCPFADDDLRARWMRSYRLAGGSHQ